ncbi:hypothetical protein [Achromobacter xylosoxidans]|uniref:hypothetical protein n=1 Tax=Alcaligenes xylosoxydans xylosoxydans TaxID=85698 RepID=UPI0005A2FDBB|nr:hypothetical protein [Achromobacter xylosoxidans]
MKISEGELQIWQAIGSVLEEEEPAEYELLPDIVETRGMAAAEIGRQPGAFDASEIPLMAGVLFGVAAPVMQAIWPKLFDALLDVGKDALKKALDRRAVQSMAPAMPSRISVSAQQIRAAIVHAATVRKLSPRTAESLADALIAQFLGASDDDAGKTQSTPAR